MLGHTRKFFRDTPSRFSRLQLAIGVFVCHLAWSTGLEAQSVTLTPGRLVGVVFDSLVSRPVPRAVVRVQGTKLETVADAKGRYTIDGVPPGRQVLTFAAPELESAGLRSAGVPVVVRAGDSTVINLTTPSLRRLWQVLCSQQPRVGLDSGIITGAVVDGDRKLRLKRAPVALTWYNLSRADLTGEYPEIRQQVRTDSLGTFYACGVPRDVSIKVRAFGDDAATGEVQFFVGTHAVRRMDLIVTKAFAKDSGAVRGTAVLRGTVRDSVGRPVGEAIISVPGADTSVRSDPDGTFIIRNLAAGTQGLLVRKVGFGMATPVVSLQEAQQSSADIVLYGVTTLDTYAVRGEATMTPREKDFLERRKLGLGQVIDVARKGSTDAIALVNNVVRVRVEWSKSGNDAKFMMRHSLDTECEAGIFLDGVATDAQRIRDFPVDRLRAVEVFTSVSFLPAQFIKISENPCGAILYWSKAAW